MPIINLTFDRLPPDIILHIMFFLDAKASARFGHTSKAIHDIYKKFLDQTPSLLFHELFESYNNLVRATFGSSDKDFFSTTMDYLLSDRKESMNKIELSAFRDRHDQSPALRFLLVHLLLLGDKEVVVKRIDAAFSKKMLYRKLEEVCEFLLKNAIFFNPDLKKTEQTTEKKTVQNRSTENSGKSEELGESTKKAEIVIIGSTAREKYLNQLSLCLEKESREKINMVSCYFRNYSRRYGSQAQLREKAHAGHNFVLFLLMGTITNFSLQGWQQKIDLKSFLYEIPGTHQTTFTNMENSNSAISIHPIASRFLVLAGKMNSESSPFKTMEKIFFEKIRKELSNEERKQHLKHKITNDLPLQRGFLPSTLDESRILMASEGRTKAIFLPILCLSLFLGVLLTVGLSVSGSILLKSGLSNNDSVSSVGGAAILMLTVFSCAITVISTSLIVGGLYRRRQYIREHAVLFNNLLDLEMNEISSDSNEHNLSKQVTEEEKPLLLSSSDKHLHVRIGGFGLFNGSDSIAQDNGNTPVANSFDLSNNEPMSMENPHGWRPA